MNNVYKQKSKIGITGVFAKKDFHPSEKIMEFTGKRLSPEEAENRNIEEYTVQVGDNIYMGPSGKEDDEVNHSCNPNTGLVWLDDKLWLISIRWILEDEEITFDYSTTIGPNDEWTMMCNCGELNCRKIIQKFNLLPKEIQDKYIDLDIALANNW